MPSALRRILARTLGAIARLSKQLERGTLSAAAWRAAMERVLTQHYAAALMAGQGSESVSTASRTYLDLFAKQQARYLKRFAAEIAAEGYKPAYAARAAMYAAAAKAPFWHGRTKGLPLPAMPGDGTTQCLSNCRCSWEIVPLDGDGNYDCYWRMGAVEHCQTCVQRASDWAPLRVRGGELQ